MTDVEKITALSSEKVLGYFESAKSVFYVKMGMIAWFEMGDRAKHGELSAIASEVAGAFSDELAEKVLSSITGDVVENLKEDAVTALLVSGWSVFELIIKDLTTPDYALNPNQMQADFHNSLLGFSQAERDEIALFYHLRNAVVHYNGAYHAYRMVDVSYQGTRFKSEGHIGEKIVISPKLAMHIISDLEKYAMKAWSNRSRA